MAVLALVRGLAICEFPDNISVPACSIGAFQRFETTRY